MSSLVKRGNHGRWGTAVRASSRTSGYLAWGCLGETSGTGPLREKEEVWFQFGATEQEALDRLHDELDGLPV